MSATGARRGRWRALCVLVGLLAWSVVARASGGPIIRVKLQPPGPVVVGQQVTATVQVLVPNYFLSAPEWPVLDIDGAIVTMSDEVLPHLSETIGGDSYVGVQQAYVITPGQEGEITLPPIEIRFQYAAVPGQPPADGVVTLPPTRIVARWPAGAHTEEGILPVARLTVRQTLDRSLARLKAGDAITRTIAVDAAHTQPMMIRPPAIEAPDGVRVYRKDPSLSSDLGVHGELNAGRRIDRVTYLFEKPGHYTLPAIEFPWFDTASASRKTAEAPAIVVDVAPNLAAGAAIAPEAPPPAPAPPPPSLWQVWKPWLPWIIAAAAALLAFGWLFARLWPQYRRWSAARRKVRAESERAAFDDFGQECDSNDRSRAYASLARWAGRAGHASIAGWCDALGYTPFTKEVKALEQSMFAATSPDDAAWSGAQLKRTARAARSAWQSRESRKERRPAALPLLNPRWSAARQSPGEPR
jgi:hypothetical protein